VTADGKRTLILLRHAKSDWSEDVPDHDRPLSKRGRRDAPEVGRWLSGHGYLPDTVVCSTAQRTRQTWDLVAARLGGVNPVVTFEPRAYGATELTLLYLVRELQPATRAVLLIGHNPGIGELASALAEAPLRFPTAAVAVLEFDGDWSDLEPGQAYLADFAIPADLHQE
jgi:phosphohistidine phosphatase